ncbi:MAG: hydrogenase subunit MbhD domain-containing protein [Desulfurococcaceae archaeon]
MLLTVIVVFVASFISVIAAYLAVTEKDLLTAAVYTALLGASYTLIYYVLMAPDVALAYIPVSSALIPFILIVVLKKTERYER